MKLFLNFSGKKLHYSDQGKGSVIVFLHGYLESLAVWSDFAKTLSENYRVICFDIPGHGKSDELEEKHTMKMLAESISSALHFLKIEKCFMVGHSMGGYLALMFHKLYPQQLSGFCLFHSHPFSDSEEKKRARLREIKLILDDKKNLIASTSIPNTFATENMDLFKNHIEEIKQEVEQFSNNGIVANLYAMMHRPDLSVSLTNSKLPFLYIAGKKDNLIDLNTVVPKIKFPINSEMLVLENSGHMGFIEEKEKSVTFIDQFLKKSN